MPTGGRDNIIGKLETEPVANVTSNALPAVSDLPINDETIQVDLATAHLAGNQDLSEMLSLQGPIKSYS